MSGKQQHGEYGEYLWSPQATKACGGILIAAGLIGIIGAGVETGAAVYYYTVAHFYGGVYSWTDFCGYWCGAIIMLCGGVAIFTAIKQSDHAIIANLIFGSGAFVCSIIMLWLPAEQMSTVEDSYEGWVSQTMLLAAFAIMTSAGILGMCTSTVIILDMLRAVIRGIRNKRHH